MKKRTFVSIELTSEVKQKLRQMQKADIYWIKWMPPANLHITLNFLGDLDEEEIEHTKQVLQEIAAAHQSFKLLIKRARAERDMLWFLPEYEAKLSDLQDDLTQKLKEARVGKRERKKYVPHVLLAKSKTGRPMIWKPDRIEPMEFEVKSIALFESQLTPGAATHILIQSFNLA